MLLENVTFTSYLGGALLLAALTLISFYLLLKRYITVSLTVAALISMIWSAVLAFDSLEPRLTVQQLVLCETLRFGSWIFGVLQQLKYTTRNKKAHRGPFLILHLLWITCGTTFVFLIPLFIENKSEAYQLYVWSCLLLTIFSIVAVEQLFRNSPQYRINKVYSLGLAAIFLYDLYMFSYALLFGQLDHEIWRARGAVNGTAAIFLCFSLLAVSSQNSPQQNRVAISRPMAFYTTSLTTAGFFLALMAAGGYYIKLYGGNWGTVLQVTLIFSALVSIAVMFMSQTARANLSVYIDKHFFVHKYDYRAQWLNLIHQLSSASSEEDPHLNSIKALANVVKSTGGMLWMDNQFGRFIPISTLNMKLPKGDIEEPSDSEFCKILRDHEWVFSPTAPKDNELNRYNEYLPSWCNDVEGLWLIIPLLVDNELIGFMLLSSPPQDFALTWEDLDLFKTVGRELASYISRNEAAELLAQSKQFDAYNKLSAFIMHDLKNLIAQQALVVENAAKHKENPAFIEDMIRTIDNSVQRMSSLLKKLQQTQPSSGRQLDLKNVVINSVKKCQDRLPPPTLRIMEDSLKVIADEDNLEMIITHVIKNAQEATPTDGYVDVTLRMENDCAYVEVEDNGSGMDSEFVKNRLFRPFDTTKSGKGMGIGVYQTREFIRNLGGDVQVKSEPQIGTTFTICIPLDNQPNSHKVEI
ncbi:PEP-CTERM system histidine kinase PrsK [Ketobacter sp. MCCC 1A13808]|uniref:XrtA/PEP-CTERM system histidine kinase PrsK n=1 Tax=Ketobacter sp. MCCC 1A13808 TaxID=2602738 RepID=UPI0012EBEF10|nr:XrtA/PEP-CTERM system histidine kinase PrsK [Ketobacter sp. MCCC 1A13808]MVF10542.1 PEP-CTERM system histidine kinase PrsK [Ketobacter sp. MCCC 1A13808]